MNNDDHLTPAEERWVEERNAAYSRSRGLGFILRVIVVLFLMLAGYAVALVISAAAAAAQATPPVIEILDAAPGTTTALADTGVDPGLVFLAAVLLTLVGLIAWGLHRKAAR